VYRIATFTLLMSSCSCPHSSHKPQRGLTALRIFGTANGSKSPQSGHTTLSDITRAGPCREHILTAPLLCRNKTRRVAQSCVVGHEKQRPASRTVCRGGEANSCTIYRGKADSAVILDTRCLIPRTQTRGPI